MQKNKLGERPYIDLGIKTIIEYVLYVKDSVGPV
jgi:hypothetical protein